MHSRVSHEDHNREIATAAKSVLAPLGCIRKGRSRVWLDDQGWWVGKIEFQPSSCSKGSYLNVGASYLWCQRRFNSDPPSGLIVGVNLTHPS